MSNLNHAESFFVGAGFHPLYQVSVRGLYLSAFYLQMIKNSFWLQDSGGTSVRLRCCSLIRTNIQCLCLTTECSRGQILPLPSNLLDISVMNKCSRLWHSLSKSLCLSALMVYRASAWVVIHSPALSFSFRFGSITLLQNLSDDTTYCRLFAVSRIWNT